VGITVKILVNRFCQKARGEEAKASKRVDLNLTANREVLSSIPTKGEKI
jgi:hypothetical protein